MPESIADHIGQPLGQRPHLVVAADHPDGQHRDSRASFHGSGFRCNLGLRHRFRLSGNADLKRIDPYRLDNVFELGLAQIADRQIEPRSHLSVSIFRKTNGSRLGDTLQSRGDIDAVPHQIAVALLNHVAQMDANPELDAALRRQARIALDHRVLNLDGAPNGVNDTTELDERSIAGALDDTTLMYRDRGIDQVAA